MQVCICVSGWAAGGLGGPRAPVTQREFLIPGSHSWLQLGCELEGSKCVSVCVCFCGPLLTWTALRPCRMSSGFKISYKLGFHSAGPNKTFWVCVCVSVSQNESAWLRLCIRRVRMRSPVYLSTCVTSPVRLSATWEREQTESQWREQKA